MRRILFRLGVAIALTVLASGCASRSGPQPLLWAHAHNDYEHARPLLDALEHGFANIEADIWLVEGKLLVAHDRKSVKPERTLEVLYLEPLRARVRENGGRVWRGGPTLTLLVDVKSEARATYAALEAVLAGYAEILTVYEAGKEKTGAVTVVVSGNRTPEDMAAKARRYSALDGRSTELDSTAPATLYPWISENWTKLSKWKGEGALPEADRATLRNWVDRAHAQGRKIRFWNFPETPEAWRILTEAGVDVIGTDHLARLRDFLREEKGL
ncbi:MAG: phosphatidylinositol-specific phospholipase C/glycerophosphodiester phosphodiesterase family protein [Verrucomicrobiota bacterium]